ncbi:MAG: PKD domain-containing protein [Bacteroidia bacterium]
MKKIIYTLILFLTSTHLFASHGMGGEITWTCQGTSYVFKLKFYRDCNGIPGPPGPLTLQHNIPGGPNISLVLQSQTDISPDGGAGTGNQPCPTCAGASGNTAGAVEEFVFLSAPIVLPGTPPASGWAFWWGDCCRSAALDNISGGGSWSFGLRAKMYPYVGFPAGQCKDNSPYFAEKPSTIICTGYRFTYNHNAVDQELDSIVYAWDSPIEDVPAPWTPNIPYCCGYSVNNQLPGTPTLNTQSGELSYLPLTGGYFVTVIKVQAWKCGTLAAEIWREINVVLINGCTIPIAGNPKNFPPVITPPFPDPITGVPLSSYQDTVIAGDTVKFTLPATDFDVHPPNLFQIITFTASGNEYGAGFTNPLAGCVLPPCATLSPPPPVSSPFAMQIGFNWRTACAHVKGLDTNCTRISNTYNFVIKASDDFCPANGISIGTIRITVKMPPKLLPPKIKCASVINKFGDVELSWAPPTPRDTHATFADYEIWAATNAAGPYHLVDSVFGSLSEYYTTTDLISNTVLNDSLGTNGQNSSIYFKMYTRCGCDSDSISIASNIVRTIKPIATQGAGGVVNLIWNPIHNPWIATAHNKYYVYKEYPIGTWTLIDSTTHPTVTYIDPTTNTICNDTLTYRIQTGDDSLMCTSWSAYAGIRVINAAPVSTITPANPAFCTGQNVMLTANPANATTYVWSTGVGTQSINVAAAGTYTVTLTFMPGGCTSSASTTTVVNVVPTATLAGTTSICAGQNTNLTFTFTGTGPWNYSYNSPSGVQAGVALASPLNIAVSPAATFNYTMATVSNAACTGNVAGNANITVNTIPSATISGTTAICAGQNANITVTFGNGPGPYSFVYNPGAIPVNNVNSPYVFPVNPGATTNYTLVSMSNANCSGTISGIAAITVNTLPTASITGTTSICTGQNTNLIVTFANAPGPYSFTYNPGGILVTGATNPAIINVSPAATTNYSLVSVSNANCTGSITGAPAVVTVNTIPSAFISGSPSICVGQQANLTVNFAGAPGPYNFVYNPGNVPVNGATNPAFIAVTPGATTNYTLVSVNNANCPGTVNGQATVTVHPLPTAQITGTQTVCAGQAANLNINFSGTGPWHYTYLINGTPSGPLIANVSPAVIAVNPAATTTYTLSPTVTDLYCTGNASGTAIVSVTPLPTAQILGNATVCAGTATNLTINFTGTAPFVYSYNAGATVMGPYSTGLNSVTIPVAPTSTTVYTLPPTITGAGCTGNTGGSATVTVNQLPTAAITGSDTICNGTATNLAINFAGGPGPYTYTYTANSTSVGPLNTNSNPTIIPVNPSVNTTYVITNISNANCPGTVTGTSAVVHVTPIPTATISGTPSICLGQGTYFQVAFTGQAPYTYSYYAGATPFGPFTTNSNVAIVNVAPNATTNYTLSPTVIGNGCIGNTSGNAVVTVHSLPTAHIAGNPIICAGDNTDLSISFTGTSPYTYRYTNGTSTFGPFTTSNNPETITVTPPATSTYTVSTVSDLHCSGTASGSSLVTVNPLPTSFITGTAIICQGVQTNLNIAFTGTPPFSYSYSDGTNTFGPIVTNNNSVSIPASPSVTTTYSATAISDANCTGNPTSIATVTVNQLPTALLTVGPNPVICNGQSSTLVVNFTGTAPFIFSYNDGTNTYGPITTSANPYTITVAPTSSTTYHLAPAVTGAGCSGAASGVAAITVNQLPTATVAGTPVICNGASTTFGIVFTGAPPFTYSYSNGSTTFGPFTTSNLSATITVSPTVTTPYQVTAISDDNCTGTASGQALVTVNQLPTAQLTGTTAICYGSSSNLSINFTGSGPYTYSYSDGTNTFGPFTTPNDPEIVTVQPTLPTTTYSVTNVSDANCNGTVTGNTATVTVYNLPSAVVSGISEICIGASSSFTITFTGAAPFTYRYSDGTLTHGPYTTSTNPLIVPVAPLTTTNYSLVSLSDLHCPGSFSGSIATVTVHNLPTPAISGVNVICDGNSTTFTANPGYVNYIWSTTATSPDITLTTAGTYTVTVTDNFGCVSATSQSLVVNQTPEVSFTNDTSLTCAIPKINFFNTSVFPAGSTFQWNFGDNGVSSVENPSHVFTAPGTYPITLVINTQEMCTDTLTDDINIMFFPLPQADFKAEPSVVNVFNSSVSFVDKSLYAVTWNWTFGDGAQSAEQNPKHYFDEIGKYSVKLVITNIAGCVSEYSDPVLITPFYVPNAFTPNGDGMNDEFFNAGYIMDISSYDMMIFNRWGQKVFENNDYHKFWNGLDRNNNPSPEGTYVYSIKVITKTGKPFEYQGSVALVR